MKLVVLHRSASDNARSAIEDSSAIAYIGEPEPGLSANSIGITNAQDLLQVSPTDTAPELTRSTPAVKGAPRSYYESTRHLRPHLRPGRADERRRGARAGQPRCARWGSRRCM